MTLYSLPFSFARRELSLEEAEYAVVGAPYDSSESFMTGSRDAPQAIRRASQEVEDYDLLEGFDLGSIKLADMGDVEVSFGSAEETRKRVGGTVKELLDRGAKPVMLGGEHTVSAFALEAYEKKPLFLSLDAHLDFREEYLGNRYSHASVFRRACDTVGERNVMALGVRSASRREIEDARELGVSFVPIWECYPVEKLASRLAKEFKGRAIYLSIDMDFFDPREARGVGNLEPLGMCYSDFLSLLSFLGGVELAGLDVTEVIPSQDYYTPVLAARAILKVLARSML